MMQTIKNCPVCGAEAELKETVAETSHEWIETVYWVECKNHHLERIHGYQYVNKDHAVEEWNRWDGGKK